MNKAKVNYWVDVVTALAFILSAVSGIVFLFPINGSTVLGIAYNIWDQIHTWGSLLMLAGVLVHLILHWKWIVVMTGKILFPTAKPLHSTATASGGVLMSRRRFLRTAGLGVVGLGAAGLGAAMTALSYKSLFGSEETVARPTVPPTAAPTVLTEENQAIVEQQPEATSIPAADTPTATLVPTEENQAIVGQQSETTSVPATDTPTATPVPTEETNEVVVQPEATSIPPTVIPTQSVSVATSVQTFSVACPKGITYDPYPGHCRHYVDKDGDGYCDLSIPTAN